MQKQINISRHNSQVSTVFYILNIQKHSTVNIQNDVIFAFSCFLKLLQFFNFYFVSHLRSLRGSIFSVFWFYCGEMYAMSSKKLQIEDLRE